MSSEHMTDHRVRRDHRHRSGDRPGRLRVRLPPAEPRRRGPRRRRHRRPDRLRRGRGRRSREGGLLGRLGRRLGGDLRGGRAIAAAEIPVGGGKVFEALKVVVTQPTAGDFKAFSATCTHQACTVAEVEDGVITCPCHGSQFDMATGAVKRGRPRSRLQAKSVSVGADGITVT